MNISYSTELFHAYQIQALAELAYHGKSLQFSRLLREFKKIKKNLISLTTFK